MACSIIFRASIFRLDGEELLTMVLEVILSGKSPSRYAQFAVRQHGEKMVLPTAFNRQIACPELPRQHHLAKRGPLPRRDVQPMPDGIAKFSKPFQVGVFDGGFVEGHLLVFQRVFAYANEILDIPKRISKQLIADLAAPHQDSKDLACRVDDW
jgi:hypothetical protein